MAMDKLLRAIIDTKDLKSRLDDDFADRLNRRYTCSLLFLFTVLVSMRSYFGDAIHCWCPEVCASNHEKYANMHCWVEFTYYVPFGDHMPQSGEEKEKKITYYQWTPIIFMVQAMFFYLPCLVWQLLNRRSGINIGIIMEAARSSQRAVYAENREKTLRYAVHLLDRYLQAQRQYRTGCFARCRRMLSKHCLVYGRFSGNYLTFCYVMVKLMYTINAVGQLFMLDVILGYQYHLFGLHVMRYILYGEEWVGSDKFPRVTLCDFKIRQNTNVHTYTYQCVLPINMFHEKIFTVIWFWYFFTSIITFLSLLHWLSKFVYWPGQFRFIKRQLKAMEVAQRESQMIRKFTEYYLRRDGIFLLRMVAKNAGHMVATELLCGLWEQYGPKHRILVEPASSAAGKSRRTETSPITGNSSRTSSPATQHVQRVEVV